MKVLEFHLFSGILEAEKAELLDLFLIEAFIMGVEGALRSIEVLRNFFIVLGHISSLLLEIGGHQGPSPAVRFLVTEDLNHGVVVMRLHPVDPRFGAWAVFEQVEAIFAGVILGAAQGNVGRRGEFRFRIINEILSVASIAALLEVGSGKKRVAFLVPKTVVIDLKDLTHPVRLGSKFEVFFHQVAAINAHGLFAAMRLVHFLLCELTLTKMHRVNGVVRKHTIAESLVGIAHLLASFTLSDVHQQGVLFCFLGLVVLESRSLATLRDVT